MDPSSNIRAPTAYPILVSWEGGRSRVQRSGSELWWEMEKVPICLWLMLKFLHTSMGSMYLSLLDFGPGSQ